MDRNKFNAGIVKLQLVGKEDFITPISFQYHEKINTICDYFTFSLLDIPENYIPRLRNTEVRVYIDNEFFKGGYLDSFEKSENSNECSYSFITYGYQIAISDMIESFQYNDFAGGTIIDFINNLLKKNFKQVKKIGSGQVEVPVKNKILKQITTTDVIRQFITIPYMFKKAHLNDFLEDKESIDYDLVQTTYPLNFYIYDPNNLGKVKINSLIKYIPQSSNEISNVFEFITNILQIDNLYLKCIGRLEDLSNKIDNSFLYGGDSIAKTIKLFTNKYQEDVQNNISYSQENFVLELWQPSNKLYNKADILSADEKTNGKFTYLDINNNVESNQKKNNFDAVSKFGFADKIENKTFITTNATNVYDISNLSFIPRSLETNLISVPSHKVSFSNLFDSYLVTSETTNEEDETTMQNNIFAIDNHCISDGTTKVLKFKQENIKIKDLATHKINKDLTENYSYGCTAIGFRQNLTKEDLYKGYNPKDKSFYGTRQTAYLNVEYETSSVKNFFLIDEITMNYSEQGSFTNIHLVHPNAYSIIKYNIIDMERKTINTFIKYFKEQQW